MRPLAIALALLACPSPARAWRPVTHAGLAEKAALASTLQAVLVDRLGRGLGLYEPLALTKGPADQALLQAVTLLDPADGDVPDGKRQSALGWLIAGAVLEGAPEGRNRHHLLDEATGWLTSPKNDWNLPRLLDERERAATASAPQEREAALARALVATGALVHVLTDVGEPSHARSDLEALTVEDAPLERWVAARYGREALPEANGEPIARPHLADYLHDASGGGLADDVSHRFPRRTLARGLLPDIARYAAGLVSFLYRGRLSVDAGADTLEVTLREAALGRGTLTVYGDLPSGERKRVLIRNVEGARPGESLATLPRPPWARHATAVYRGSDENGEPIVIAEETSLK